MNVKMCQIQLQKITVLCIPTHNYYICLQMAKVKKNTFKSTSVYVTVSLSLILFLLLIFGSVFFQSQRLFKEYKEQIEIDVFFRDAIAEKTIKKIEKDISLNPAINSTSYLTKDQAWELIKEDVGGDFAKDLAEGNPLYNSINITIKGDYANLDSIKYLEKDLLTKYDSEILEIYYNKAQFKQINKNFYTYMLYFLFLCGLLIAIAVILINNTIRLAIFSKRFLIRTMQLVGAKRSFIKRPFLLNAIYQGVISGFLAIGVYIGLSFFAGQYDSIFKEIIFAPKNLETNIMMFIGVIILGIIISFTSTSFSVGKYLRLDLDKLYRF